MSEASSLSELAAFVGRSSLSTADEAERRNLATGIARRLLPNEPRRKVAELLGAVLVASARARRVSLPRAHVEIDVFSPGGTRALRLRWGNVTR